MAAKSANLYARIEPDVKEQAEEILATLGIPASNAINMFYKQIKRSMDLIEIKGKINTAICYARVVEDEAIEQIRRMCDYPMTEGSRIRSMIRNCLMK